MELEDVVVEYVFEIDFGQLAQESLVVVQVYLPKARLNTLLLWDVGVQGRHVDRDQQDVSCVRSLFDVSHELSRVCNIALFLGCYRFQ